jgi:phosphatidate cytidylyltransferase
MNFNQNGVPLNELIIVFCFLLFWGIVFCVPLFKFNFQKFFRSTIFLKILFWIPIFMVFVAVIYAGNWLRFAALAGLLIAVLLEVAKQYKPKFKKIMFVYSVLFAIGELAGAMVGVILVNTFIIEVVSVWIFIPIGFGALVGDLANSFVKRKLQTKQWSNALPGHGGFTDRFSSIAGSAALTFYFLEIVL